MTDDKAMMMTMQDLTDVTTTARPPDSHGFASFALRAVLGAAVVAQIVASGCATAPERVLATPVTEADGDRLATRMVNAMGGADAYDALQTISFEWVAHTAGFEVVRHRHDWDKKRGWHRYRAGTVDVTYRIGGDGVAFENGAEVTDPERKKLILDDAFRWWTNDVFWLLSPLKVFDPGTRRVAVDADGDGESDDLRISFENVGLTPGDAYLYTFDSTGTPRGFRFLLESGPSGEAIFVDEVTLHGVSFFLRKVAGPAEIRFEHLEVSRGPRDEIFAALLSRVGPEGPASQPSATAPSSVGAAPASMPASHP